MKKGPPAHTGYERKGNGGVVMQSLSEVKAGAVCTIKWMFGNPQVMEFMHQHDIREGKYHQCVPARKGQHDNRNEQYAPCNRK